MVARYELSPSVLEPKRPCPFCNGVPGFSVAAMGMLTSNSYWAVPFCAGMPSDPRLREEPTLGVVV